MENPTASNRHKRVLMWGRQASTAEIKSKRKIWYPGTSDGCMKYIYTSGKGKWTMLEWLGKNKPWKGRSWCFEKTVPQVLLQSILCRASKLSTTKPPRDAQWESMKGTCTAKRNGLKATGSRWPRGLVGAGACSGNTLQNTWSLLDPTMPEGWLDCRHLRRSRAQQSFREIHWERARQGRQHTPGSQEVCRRSCRAAGT